MSYLSKMNKKIISHNGEVCYRVIGSGQPVVLVHGFGEDGSIWDQQVERLKKNFQLIVPDLPGSGNSTLFTDQCTMELLAESIHLILQQESITRCVLIGHSMGGYITLAFAEKYPQLLKAFGLFHSTAYPDKEEKKEARRKSIVFIQQHGAAKFIEQFTPSLFSEGFRQNNPQIVKEVVQRYTNFSADALVHYYEAMILRPDRTAVLERFNGPVLFIMGTFDTAIPLDLNLQQCYVPRTSFIKILKDSGHMGMLEETEKANRYLEKFLDEIEIVMPVQAL